MVQLKFAPVESKNLFSRHYLDERLKTLPIWSEDKEAFERVFRGIKEFYDREKSLLRHYEEAQLEENFIKPVLRILGHVYEVQQASDRGRLTPDYAFFPDEGSRRTALKSKGKKEFYQTAIAIGDAKKWGTPLDKKSSGKARYAYDNPSYQIDAYLRDTDSKWAILTDGRFWRLYYQESSYRLDSYYEVDLAGILEKGSRPDFKYFYLFFRREAFLRDETGKNFLEKVYAEGVSYAKKIGGDLEKNVYRALKILGQGFLNWPGNNLTPTEVTIKEIHENSLIFLYRLLFILYADSRGTLRDLHKPENEYYNINRIKVLAFTRKQDHTLSEHSPELWDRLTSLFQLIDEGSESKGISKDELFVPPYNGGLFHSQEHPFLAKKKVGDKYVGDVLELLTVSPDGDIAGFIDYSTLEIRHLGSIYEGLLEYKLHVADKNLVAIKQKGRGVWIPEEKAEGKKVIDAVKAGDLYLVTDKGERKATGSYYTPDYIVKYIVENTISPLVEEKLKGAATDEEKIERILSIKVLDPAMGSGHFLVEATDFLAEKIVPFVKPEQLGDEREIDWARREVVKRCIYGVDLNPLATELAKLSLWLNTLEANRPLSFLDHHLKVGNSLIGADIHMLDKHPTELKAGEKLSQASLSEFMRASIRESIDKLLNMYTWIMERAEEKIEDIKYKEQIFKELLRQPLRRRFIELANLHTSYYFGNEFTKSEYEEAVKAFQGGEEAWRQIKEKEYFKRAQEIARKKNFIHWKLEFPETFFEPGKDKENPGFDAVIGNPPYGATIESKDKTYLSKSFETIYREIESYALFIEKSIKLSKNNGSLGKIVSHTLLTGTTFSKLRKFILNKIRFNSFIELGPFVFKEVGISTAVITGRISGNNENENLVKIAQYLTYQTDLEKNVNLVPQKVFSKMPDNVLNVRLTSSLAQFVLEIDKKSKRLKEISEISRGIETGYSDPTISKTQKTSTYKKLLGQSDVHRYQIDFKGLYIPFDKQNISKFKQEKYHSSPKILMQRLRTRSTSRDARWIIATFDNEHHYILKTLYSIILPEEKKNGYSELYILSVLNSSLMNAYFKLISLSLDIFVYQLERLPIRRINFATQRDERGKLVNQLKELYSQKTFDVILTLIDSYLPRDEGGDFITKKEKSDVVHDFIAFLAARIIDLNKEKNKEIKGFLEWFEGYTKLKVDDMALKSKVREYYKHDWEEMSRILAKNKGKIKEFDVARREPQEKIRREYADSIAKLKPLLERIEETDKFIDEIVYKLYGLTEGEIKIVEASCVAKRLAM